MKLTAAVPAIPQRKLLPWTAVGTPKVSSHCALLGGSPFTTFKYSLLPSIDRFASDCQDIHVLGVGVIYLIYCSFPVPRTTPSIQKAPSGPEVNEQNPAGARVLCITSRLQTPLKVVPSLPVSVSLDLTECLTYRRSSVDIYPVTTEGKMRPFQCAAINEISMHTDLETNNKKIWSDLQTGFTAG